MTTKKKRSVAKAGTSAFPFTKLPVELQIHILTFTTYATLKRFMVTSKRMSRLVRKEAALRRVRFRSSSVDRKALQEARKQGEDGFRMHPLFEQTLPLMCGVEWADVHFRYHQRWDDAPFQNELIDEWPEYPCPNPDLLGHEFNVQRLADLSKTLTDNACEPPVRRVILDDWGSKLCIDPQTKPPVTIGELLETIISHFYERTGVDDEEDDHQEGESEDDNETDEYDGSEDEAEDEE